MLFYLGYTLLLRIIKLTLIFNVFTLLQNAKEIISPFHVCMSFNLCMLSVRYALEFQWINQFSKTCVLFDLQKIFNLSLQLIKQSWNSMEIYLKKYFAEISSKIKVEKKSLPHRSFCHNE